MLRCSACNYLFYYGYSTYFTTDSHPFASMQEDFSHASEDAGGAAERGGARAGGVSDILVEDILERLECDVMCATATQSLARAPHFTPL